MTDLMFVQPLEPLNTVRPVEPNKDEYEAYWKALLDGNNEHHETLLSDPDREGYVCPGCNTWEHVNDEQEEVICMRCGVIVEYKLDSSAEYRWFGSDDRNPDPTRCSAPINPLLPESSLGTTILVRREHGREMQRIKRYHQWNQTPYRERTLYTIFDSLNVRAVNSGISVAMIEEAKQLFANLSKNIIARGVQREALLASCLYESLKRHSCPRRPRDIAKIFQLELTDVTRGIKQFQHLFAKTYSTEQRSFLTDNNDLERSLLTTTGFGNFVIPFLQNLAPPRHLFKEMNALVLQVCERADEWGLVPENTPPSLVASAIMIVCEHLSWMKAAKEVATACDISAVTITKCLKRLTPYKPKLLQKGEVE